MSISILILLIIFLKSFCIINFFSILSFNISLIGFEKLA
jgi:hypothetical protein